MYKLLILVFALVAATASSYAQLGTSSVGNINGLGTISTGQPSFIGNRTLAAASPGDCSCSTPTLLHLTATRQNANEVALSWYTANGNSHSRFAVQRSFTGRHSFQKTALIINSKTGNRKTNYALADANAFHGVTYYRIEQQDANGKLMYSDTVSVAGMKDPLSLYPNPASDYCNLVLPADGASSAVTVLLYDASGSVVYQQRYDAIKKSVIRLDHLSLLPPGVYAVAVQSETEMMYGKLTLMR